jgi:periplasmic protein CpxP/Spy
MDIFAEKKFLVRLCILLALINVFFIGYFLWKDVLHHNEPHLFPGGEYRDVSAILQKELNLSAQQVELINKLRADYFEREKKLASVIRGERDSMNTVMFNKSTDEELIKSLARSVAENEYQMELLRFDQAKELKAICTPDQLEKFQRLVIEIRDYFRPDNQPKKR